MTATVLFLRNNLPFLITGCLTGLGHQIGRAGWPASPFLYLPSAAMTPPYLAFLVSSLWVLEVERRSIKHFTDCNISPPQKVTLWGWCWGLNLGSTLYQPLSYSPIPKLWLLFKDLFHLHSAVANAAKLQMLDALNDTLDKVSHPCGDSHKTLCICPVDQVAPVSRQTTS